MADVVDLRDLTDEEATLVRDFVELLRKRHAAYPGAGDDEEQEREWGHVPVASFADDWDNPQDAVYDNWRERYRVPER